MDLSLSSNSLSALTSEPVLRQARLSDTSQIFELYNRLYGGKYTDPILSDITELRRVLILKDYFWMVAESENKLVGSVIYRFSAANSLAKVYGAVVDPDFRGHDLTERLMAQGYVKMREEFPPVEVVYATTRTVSPAPQRLTSKLGYKKLGIFPNVHKTEGYETHCLTALLTEKALRQRFTDFTLHPGIAPLFAIAAKECGLEPIQTAEWSVVKSLSKKAVSVLPKLEKIDAVEFVRHRFNLEKETQGQNWFFPFHEPNLLFTSPDQTVEVFCYLSAKDRHCVLIGIQDLDKLGYFSILESVSSLLRDLGTRYIEFIVPAADISKNEQAIQAELIPCGYFPAMTKEQWGEQNLRYDFVVYSRSFETLNFKNISLDGVNKLYLSEYFKRWKEQSALDLE